MSNKTYTLINQTIISFHLSNCYRYKLNKKKSLKYITKRVNRLVVNKNIKIVALNQCSIHYIYTLLILYTMLHGKKYY